MFFGLFDFAGRRNRKLGQAAKQGDRFTVRELLAKGADPNERDPDGQDCAWNTPLLAAAGNGAFEVVQAGYDEIAVALLAAQN